MEDKYLIYEREKLSIENSPLGEHLDKWKERKQPSPLYDNVWKDDIGDTVARLNKRWVYKPLYKRGLKTPASIAHFKATLNGIFNWYKDGTRPTWDVGGKERPTNLMDTMLFTGEMLDITLSRRRKDLWDAKRSALLLLPLSEL